MKFIVIVLLSFSCMNAFAQTKEAQNSETDTTRKKPIKQEYEYVGDFKFKKRNNWVCIGIGPNFIPDVPFVNANINGDYSFHHPKVKDYVFQVGYTNNSFNYVLQSSTVSYLQTLNFSVGRFREKRYWKVAAFVGPSLHYTRYYVFNEEKTLSRKRTVGVGLHAETQFIAKPAYDVGIGVSPFVDVNTTQTVFGLSFGVYFSNAMVKKIKR